MQDTGHNNSPSPIRALPVCNFTQACNLVFSSNMSFSLSLLCFHNRPKMSNKHCEKTLQSNNST